MENHINRILNCEHHDPFEFLGVHFSKNDPLEATFRTFQPQALNVLLVVDGRSIPMVKSHDSGLFQLTLEITNLKDQSLDPFNYQYKITFFDGNTTCINDPFRFLPQLEEYDRFLFNSGTNYQLYNHMGAHLKSFHNINGVIFRVWAPAAKSVSVIGDFNSWDGRLHPCRSLGTSGIWELFIPGLVENELYRFQIKTQNNDILEKSDPFQFYGELRPNTASIVKDVSSYDWNDSLWQGNKKRISPYNLPLSIYEVHPGSWQRDPKDSERFLSFRELAAYLIPHVKKLGFTHIELMPVMEHPLDESWGYQVTCPYSMTSRYGTPDDLKYFVDECHQQNIGVILDWVPAHFPKDSYSLGRFDGTALYEHEDPRKGSHPEWGTYIFNYGRKEVSNYLIANALFWIDKFHIDGLRVDAVASMLYLNYSRKEGEWIPNCYGGKENLEAIEFIKHLNSIVYQTHPNTLMIAEESTSFFGVSKPTNHGGLGFGYKWNMGWMNDILSYFAKDPLFRKYHHNSLTFSIMYAFSENFILPLSHDEVVHGKKSLIEKMPGDEWQKFANLRLLFLSMWLHPGKKLLFMGCEFGQWSEWYCKRSLDWHLIKEGNLHYKLLKFVEDLNQVYTANPSLWQLDFDGKGFSWLDLGDKDNSIISFARSATDPQDHIVCVLNFTPQTFTDYKIALPTNRPYKLLFCSNDEQYGGSNLLPNSEILPINEPYAKGEYHTVITVPPLCGILLQPI